MVPLEATVASSSPYNSIIRVLENDGQRSLAQRLRLRKIIV